MLGSSWVAAQLRRAQLHEWVSIWYITFFYWALCLFVDLHGSCGCLYNKVRLIENIITFLCIYFDTPSGNWVMDYKFGCPVTLWRIFRKWFPRLLCNKKFINVGPVLNNFGRIATFNVALAPGTRWYLCQIFSERVRKNPLRTRVQMHSQHDVAIWHFCSDCLAASEWTIHWPVAVR
jgi:hypothetical protein